MIARNEQLMQTMNDYQDLNLERTQNLNHINMIIARLMKKGNFTIGTQTDPIQEGGLMMG